MPARYPPSGPMNADAPRPVSRARWLEMNNARRPPLKEPILASLPWPGQLHWCPGRTTTHQSNC